jgi:hypothetical protein
MKYISNVAFVKKQLMTGTMFGNVMGLTLK